MYTILRIGDGSHNYPFLLQGDKVYWPDFNPEAFGKSPRYRLSYNHWVGALRTEPVSYILDSRETLPCVPFREENYTYHQYSQLPRAVPIGEYIDFHVVMDNDEEDPNYISVQGKVNSTGVDTDVLYINILSPLTTEQRPHNPEITVQAVVPGGGSIESYLKSCYSADLITTTWEIALVDENDIYWRADREVDGTPTSAIFELDWQFDHSFQFLPELKFIAVCKNELVIDDNFLHVDIRSNPLPLTPDMYEYLMAVQNGYIIEALDKNNTKDMQIFKPRIMDKTVQNVVEMTSQTDSKANIIQPVFFRSRELAHIIIHPAVTENIAINLDAYKSQVERFYIKIEGASFSEVGRVEGGVIFKVQGNLLPGASIKGTYYILNQNAELVTTGKYTYSE